MDRVSKLGGSSQDYSPPLSTYSSCHTNDPGHSLTQLPPVLSRKPFLSPWTELNSTQHFLSHLAVFQIKVLHTFFCLVETKSHASTMAARGGWKSEFLASTWARRTHNVGNSQT